MSRSTPTPSLSNGKGKFKASTAVNAPEFDLSEPVDMSQDLLRRRNSRKQPSLKRASQPERGGGCILEPDNDEANFCEHHPCAKHGDQCYPTPEAPAEKPARDFAGYEESFKRYCKTVEDLVDNARPPPPYKPPKGEPQPELTDAQKESAKERAFEEAIGPIDALWKDLTAHDGVPIFIVARLCRLAVDTTVEKLSVRDARTKRRIRWAGCTVETFRPWVEAQGKRYASPVLECRGRDMATFNWDKNGEDGDVVRWMHKFNKRSREAVKKLSARVEVLKKDVELNELLLDQNPDHQAEVVDKLTEKLATWLNRAVGQHHDRVYGRCLHERHDDQGRGGEDGAGNGAAGKGSSK